jgi:dTDP-glucose 4,6-dehydratase
MKLLITGGAGFIGSNFCKMAVNRGHEILVFDALTYAGHLENLESLNSNKKFQFVKGSICDIEFLRKTVNEFAPDVFINMAAESHVDNSILGPLEFVNTNILGTFNCLEVFKNYYAKNKSSRYVQISTDEVFGSLGDTGFFTEESKYQPHSPYSATKASGDLLCDAWFHTYGLPISITHCSNNYGPNQLPEKLIPKTILCCLEGRKIPVYGKGLNTRDWIYVDDHCEGIFLTAQKGKPGEHYCFGGRCELKNIDLVNAICRVMDELKPMKSKYSDLIHFVDDRAGHDWRYAIDDSKAMSEFGFTRKFKNFEQGLLHTIKWYLENGQWIEKIKAKGVLK